MPKRSPLSILTFVMVRHPLALLLVSCLFYSSLLYISYSHDLFKLSEQELRDYLVQSHQTTIDYVKKVAAEEAI